MNHQGSIEVIYGPMFSGKSSELLRRMKRHVIAQKTCIVLTSILDDRPCDDNPIYAHNQNSCSKRSLTRLSQFDEESESYSVIGIDDGQFFDDLTDFCEKWANMGKIVITAALDSTFKREAFRNSTKLLSYAESIKKLSAVCQDCGKKASFTKRIINSDSNKKIIIGDADVYKAVCR